MVSYLRPQEAFMVTCLFVFVFDHNWIHFASIGIFGVTLGLCAFSSFVCPLIWMHLEPIGIFGNDLNLGLSVGLSFDLAFETSVFAHFVFFLIKYMWFMWLV